MAEKKPGAAQRRKWLNLFDIVIILLALLAGAAVWYLTSGRSRSGEVTRTVRYTIELTGMRGDTAHLVKVGDALVDNVRKYRMGNVVSVTVEPSEYSIKDEYTGDYHIQTAPGLETARIVLETTAVENEDSILADGGYVIRGGLSVSVVGPGYSGTGYILQVERGDGK